MFYVLITHNDLSINTFLEIFTYSNYFLFSKDIINFENYPRSPDTVRTSYLTKYSNLYCFYT